MKGGFGSSMFIKNIGNYTAWDVIYDSTISGGLVFIGKHYSTNISELQPGQEITLNLGLILGFGKVTISLQISAANVKEMSSEHSAFLLFVFLLSIK